MKRVNPYQSPAELVREPHDEAAAWDHDVLLRGSMPLSDVLHAQYLIGLRQWPYVVGCLASYALCVLLLATWNGPQSLFSHIYLVLGFVVLPGILPLSLFMVYLRLRRDARRRVGIFAVADSCLTSEGVVTSLGGERVCLLWTRFRGYLDSSRVIVLFLDGAHSHLIVSRAKLVRPDDWAFLLERLRARFPE
jgi:hypothetical protein